MPHTTHKHKALPHTHTQTHTEQHTNLKGGGNEGVCRGETNEKTAECLFFLGSRREKTGIVLHTRLHFSVFLGNCVGVNDSLLSECTGCYLYSIDIC